MFARIWKSVKRNPVLNVFILTALGQISHDYLEGTIDWDNITVYIATVAMGVIARMFAVPANEHEDLKESVSKVIVRLEADYQNRLHEMLDRFDGGNK